MAPSVIVISIIWKVPHRKRRFCVHLEGAGPAVSNALDGVSVAPAHPYRSVWLCDQGMGSIA